MKHRIPVLLIIFRLLLAPVILFITWKFGHSAKPLILVLMYLGLFSDIFDGIIARHLKVSSQGLRRFDSQTDMIFWVSIGVSTWMLYPQLIKDNAIPIIIVFIMEGLCYASVLYGLEEKPAHMHSYLKCGVLPYWLHLLL